MRDTEGEVNAVICGIGTGGTVTGIGKYLKEKKKSVKIIGVEPVGSVFKTYLEQGILAEASDFDIEGIGKNFIPGVVNFDYVDEVIQVRDEEALRTVNVLVKEEGILAGGSSGAAIAAAIRYAIESDGSEHIVAILPDTGLKYLSKLTGVA